MPDRLTEIEARAEAATEGPWEVARFDYEDGAINWQVWCGAGTDNDKAHGYNCDDLWAPNVRKTSEFIAHARTDIPYLLARLRSAERVVEAARRAYAVTNTRDRVVLLGGFVAPLVSGLLGEKLAAHDAACADEGE